MKTERGNDDAWAHCTRVDDQEGKRVRCNHCSKVVPGITRLKLHLAKLGGDATPCPSVPESVSHEFRKGFHLHPYPRVVRPNKNQDLGESAGGQHSHSHHQSGSYHNVALQHPIIVDLDPEDSPDIEVSIKAKREEINQMVENKMYERMMKKKHVEGGSTADVVLGEQTSGLFSIYPTKDAAGKTISPTSQPVQKKPNVIISDSPEHEQALDLCKAKESQPMPGFQPTDNLAWMATNSSSETRLRISNGFLIPADQQLVERQDRTSYSDQVLGNQIDQTIICTAATAEKAKSNEALIKEAETAQQNLRAIEKAYKGYRQKAKYEWERLRKIQEKTDQQLKEKVQEVEAKNWELGNLRAALEDKEKKLKSFETALDAKEKKLEHFQAAFEAKERELAAKDDEMERLRRGAAAAQAEWYMEGRDEIIMMAKKVGFNHKLLLRDPAHDPTE